MHFDPWTFLLQTVNFLVLAWLLRRFLFKPIAGAIAKRQEEAARRLDELNAARAEVDKQGESLRATRAALDAERERLIGEARAQGTIERDELLAQAGRDADEVLRQGRERLERERRDAAQALERSARTVAVQLAEQLLRSAAGTLDPERFLEKIDSLLGAARAEELRDLNEQLDHSDHVTVATAPSLPPARQKSWTERLERRLGRTLHVDYVADPQLLAGAELRLERSVLGATLRDALAAASEEIGRAADTH